MSCVDPEQMAQWARPPGEFQLSWTEDVLREALRYADRLGDRRYEIFLQGSYANRTNISQSSDVDLVVLLQLPFEENVRALDPIGLANFQDRYERTWYGWEEFREDVLASLRENYFVRAGNRCVAIEDADSLLRVPADILPAVEYRRYSAFPAPGVEIYEEGVFFRDGDGNAIVNYPKQHLRNGNAKNIFTGGRFKEVVRVAKHARNRAAADPVPSYFVECLLYNVPDDEYRASLADAYYNAIGWLDRCRRRRPAEFAGLMCQNELVAIFGKGPDQWTLKASEAFFEALLC